MCSLLDDILTHQQLQSSRHLLPILNCRPISLFVINSISIFNYCPQEHRSVRPRMYCGFLLHHCWRESYWNVPNFSPSKLMSSERSENQSWNGNPLEHDHICVESRVSKPQNIFHFLSGISRICPIPYTFAFLGKYYPGYGYGCTVFVNFNQVVSYIT